MMMITKALKNQKGTAMVETVPLMVIFVALFSFGFGLFGAIHTGTLHSIGSRTYAFETFRNRTNLNYFREEGSGASRSGALNYSKRGYRFHYVGNESDRRELVVPSERPVALGQAIEATESTKELHNTKVYEIQLRNERTSVNPIWIMVGYGICLNAQCGN
jgi:hypothetical protein